MRRDEPQHFLRITENTAGHTVAHMVGGLMASEHTESQP